MPKQVKKNSTEVAETTTIAAPATAVATASAVEAKASAKSEKTKAPKKVAEPKPVVEVKTEAPATTVSADAAPVAAAVTESAEAAIAAKSAEFSAKLNQLGSLIASLKSEFKTMERQWSKDIKAAEKASSKKKRKSGNRAPSGFVKPTKISDELAKFLDKPVGSEMARTDVTKQLNTYIRANSLQDKENGRKINPDSKLQTLLKLKKGDELTYFNLQRFMSPHFPKAVAAV
jgi:upstream activation factor subunit UAF30